MWNKLPVSVCNLNSHKVFCSPVATYLARFFVVFVYIVCACCDVIFVGGILIRSLLLSIVNFYKLIK